MTQKVYISSTFKDLKEYRSLVRSLFENQLAESFEMCKIMERMWDDGSSTPFVDECVSEVKKANIYIIILGNKVGSKPPKETRTYTEIELDTAIVGHKKLHFFRFDAFDETEIDNKVKHNELLAKFEGKPTHLFSNETELKAALLECLIPHIEGQKKEFITILLSLNSPSEPEYFLGREAELIEIAERLEQRGKLMLINAEGGIGKTTLAARYWHKSLSQYKYAAWCFCEFGITKALINLAPMLRADLSAYVTEAEQLQAVKRALHDIQHDFLLVLDNANEEDDILNFKREFSGFHWHVLMTSRCQGVLGEDIELPIYHLPPELAQDLFYKYYEMERNATLDIKVARILKALDYHTLAIEVFAKNLHEAKGILSIDEFLEKLENQCLYLHEDSFEIKTDDAEQHLAGRKAKTDDILTALYDFSFLEDNAELRKLVVELAILPSTEFSLEFLFLLLTNDEKSEKIILKANLNILNKKGWITQTPEGYRMSPVVQELSRKKNESNLILNSDDLLGRINGYLRNDGSVFSVNTSIVFPIVLLIPAMAKNFQTLPNVQVANLQYNRALFGRIKGDSVMELESLNDYQKIFTTLINLEPDNKDYLRDKGLGLNIIGDFYLRLGDAKNVKIHYTESLQIFRKLASVDANNTSWQQDLAISLSKLGDFYLQLGDAKNSESHYKEGLQIFRKFANVGVDNTSWQQDLAILLSKFGDFYLRLGDAKNAESHYFEGLKINRKLANLDEDNTRWQQDLATFLSKFGDFYLRLGDTQNAESHYTKGLHIFRKLANLDEDNTRWQQDLATSLSALGDFYLRLGNAQNAESHYTEALKIRRKLANVDADITRWQQDLAISLSKLGDFYLRLGETKNAESHYTEGLQIFRKLTNVDADNTRWQQDLATSLSKLGDFYLRLGSADNAEIHYYEGLQINRKLANLDEYNTRWQQDLAASLYILGDFYLRIGNADNAEIHYYEGSQIFRKLANVDVDNASWQQELATSLSKLGDFYANNGETKGLDLILESHQLIEHLLELDPYNANLLFDHATSYMRMGNVLRQIDREKTVPLLLHAKEILENLLSKMPDDVNYKKHLEMVLDWLKEMEE